LRENLEATEKKYYESLKEKETLKNLLYLKNRNDNIKNIDGKTDSDYSRNSINLNQSINNNAKNKTLSKNYINQISILNNNTNNNFSILNNYKNIVIGNNRNKDKPRPYFDNSKLNDSDENNMNMTIDVNNSKSNFAMFNNNLTSRNNKVNKKIIS